MKEEKIYKWRSKRVWGFNKRGGGGRRKTQITTAFDENSEIKLSPLLRLHSAEKEKRTYWLIFLSCLPLAESVWKCQTRSKQKRQRHKTQHLLQAGRHWAVDSSVLNSVVWGSTLGSCRATLNFTLHTSSTCLSSRQTSHQFTLFK